MCKSHRYEIYLVARSPRHACVRAQYLGAPLRCLISRAVTIGTMAELDVSRFFKRLGKLHSHFLKQK